MSRPAGEVTVLLKELAGKTGDERKSTYDRLIALVYSDLRRRARQQMSYERKPPTLPPTALVHEAYENLLQYEMTFEDRDHFLNIAAKAMRRLIIDHARRAKAAKRGGGQREAELQDVAVVEADTLDPDLVLDLDAAMSSLRADQVQLIELRYFAGLTLEETAKVMGLQAETAKKRWQVIRTLLLDRMNHRKLA